MKVILQTAEIERRLSAGLLPRAKRFRTYGGRSLGGSCDACGLEIERGAIEYNVQVLNDSGSVSSGITMHAECEGIWLELSRQGPAPVKKARLAART